MKTSIFLISIFSMTFSAFAQTSVQSPELQARMNKTPVMAPKQAGGFLINLNKNSSSSFDYEQKSKYSFSVKDQKIKDGQSFSLGYAIPLTTHFQIAPGVKLQQFVLDGYREDIKFEHTRIETNVRWMGDSFYALGGLNYGKFTAINSKENNYLTTFDAGFGAQIGLGYQFNQTVGLQLEYDVTSNSWKKYGAEVTMITKTAQIGLSILI